MKGMLLACSFFLALASHAQKSEVIIDAGDDKSTIFSKSLIWVAKTWRDASQAIKVKDEPSGTIIIKGGMVAIPKTLGLPVKGMTTTEVTILVKDGKAKIEFDNTQYIWSGDDKWTVDPASTSDKGMRGKWNAAALAEINGMIASYKGDLLKRV